MLILMLRLWEMDSADTQQNAKGAIYFSGKKKSHSNTTVLIQRGNRT